jgi:hypothetical protein
MHVHRQYVTVIILLGLGCHACGRDSYNLTDTDLDLVLTLPTPDF